MKSNRAVTTVLIAVIICGFAAVFFLSNFLEAKRPPLPENYADSDLAVQGANLKGYALGFEGLLADWYWMQSLQYIGNKVLSSSETNINIDNLQNLNPRLLYPYLNNAATLDPKFTTVYEYGANVLPAVDAEKAVALTEKGIANNPDNWRLYQYLGYIYWKLGDYQKAAQVYEKGSAVKDAPPWMKLMSAKMKSEGGSRETARAVYLQIYEQTEDQQIKENAAIRLLQIESLDERDAIRTALQNFQKQNNRCPNNWREAFGYLRQARLANGGSLRFDQTSLTPLDPSNAAYILQTENGKCDVNVDINTSKIPAK
ncbi:MAG TPA: hypothetical protein VF556_17440 [Pyrinomonadaceae bacterium]|jgi:tetratricopeptide (TPR) repeat protein